MKVRLITQFVAIAVLTCCCSSYVSADTINVLNGNTTGDALDNLEVADELPFTIMNLSEAVSFSTPLDLTVVSATSFDPENSTVNGSASSFGINSPTPAIGTENPSRFDVDADESITFSFNQDVIIESFQLGSFSGLEMFTFAGTTISDSDANGSNVFNFPNGGLFVGANTPFSLAGA